MTTTVEHNRAARVAGTVAWAAVLCGLLAFMMFGEVPDRTRFWAAVYHAGHVPLFGLVAVSVLGVLWGWGAPLTARWPWWSAFAASVALGATTETLQIYQPGRDPSVWHFLRNVAGAASFLLVPAMVGWKPRGPVLIRSSRRRALAACGVAAMLAASLFNLAQTVARYGERDLSYPTLFAFDGSWWEWPFIELNASAITPNARPAGITVPSDEPLARLDLGAATFPGITLDEPFPDWSGARNLVVTVVSDLDAPLPMVIRVHDATHDYRTRDRFNRSLLVRPGFNRFVIPLDEVRRAPEKREMDMRHIRQVILFAVRPAAATHVYLGPLRLDD
jgi:hypothetical protein